MDAASLVIVVVGGFFSAFFLVFAPTMYHIGRREQRRSRQAGNIAANNAESADNKGEDGWLRRAILGDRNNRTWLGLVGLTIISFLYAVLSNSTPFAVMLIQIINGEAVTGNLWPWITFFVLSAITFLFTFVAFSDEVRSASRRAMDLYDQRMEHFELLSKEKPQTPAPSHEEHHDEKGLFEKFLPIEIVGEVIGEFLLSLGKGIFTRFGG